MLWRLTTVLISLILLIVILISYFFLGLFIDGRTGIGAGRPLPIRQKITGLFVTSSIIISSSYGIYYLITH
jgi:hypothetical protein